MSLLSDVTDFLFGGVDDSAQRLQAEANARARSDILGAQARAREDVLGLVPRGQQSQAAAFQSVLDLLGQSIPAQADIFQQGNLGAQANLLAGLPQQNNAILGNPIDLSALQARAVTPNFDFVGQTLPAIPPPQPQITQQQVQQLIAQALGGGGATPFFSGGAAPPNFLAQLLSGGDSDATGGAGPQAADNPDATLAEMAFTFAVPAGIRGLLALASGGFVADEGLAEATELGFGTSQTPGVAGVGGGSGGVGVGVGPGDAGPDGGIGDTGGVGP